MTDISAHELHDRILRSLKENSAEFQRRARAERFARIRLPLFVGLAFAAGIGVGMLLLALT